MSEVSKESCLYSIKFKSQLTCENDKEAPKVSNCVIQEAVGKIKELTRSGWPIMQMSYQINDWKY